MLDVRAAAEVGEVSVRVERDGPVLKLVYEFALVLVALPGEIVQGLGLGNLPAFESLLGLRELLHLVLDRLQVGIGNLPASEVHIIVEPRFDGRAHTELHTRVKSLQRLRHKMGGRVPEYPFRLVVVPGTDGAVGKCNCQHNIICF